MFQSYSEMSFANLLGLRINLVGRLGGKSCSRRSANAKTHSFIMRFANNLQAGWHAVTCKVNWQRQAAHFQKIKRPGEIAG
jgi:hypothetical protein